MTHATTQRTQRMKEDDLKENVTAKAVLDAAFELHRQIGPGLLESVYEHLLYWKLIKRGLKVERQVPVRLELDGVVFDEGFRMDLLVEDCVIVELKSVVEFIPVHSKQLRTHLILSHHRLGLLINFNVALLRDGILRIVNGL